VANLRIDQAWGSAQIMGALHDVNSVYYVGTGASAASLGSGHPDDKVGWVVGAGLKLNAPFFGVGDYFQAQVNYTQGALRYVFQTSQPSWSINDTGNSAGYGVITDAVYNGLITSSGAGAATSLELTTAWNVNAAYEHFWNPRWRTSLYGGYAQVSYNSNANSILCGFGPPNLGFIPQTDSECRYTIRDRNRGGPSTCDRDLPFCAGLRFRTRFGCARKKLES
jgi:hypothetical protein